MEELPQVAALHERWVGAGLRTQFLTEYPAEEMRNFLDTHPLPFEFYADANSEFERFGMDLIWGSEFLLINKDRRALADNLHDIERLLPELMEKP